MKEKEPPRPEQERGGREPGRGRDAGAPGSSIPRPSEVHTATEGLHEEDAMRLRGNDETRNEGPPRPEQWSGGGLDTSAGSGSRSGMFETTSDGIAQEEGGGGSRRSGEVRKEEQGGGGSRGKGRKEAAVACEGQALQQQRKGTGARARIEGEFKAWVGQQLAQGTEFSLPRHHKVEEYDFALAAAAAAACCASGEASSSSTMATTLGVSMPSRASSSAPAAAPPEASAASSSSTQAEKRGKPLSYKQRRTVVLETIRPWLPPGPLFVSDEKLCKQIATAIQEMRGTDVDIENLSGEEALRAQNWGRSTWAL